MIKHKDTGLILNLNSKAVLKDKELKVTRVIEPLEPNRTIVTLEATKHLSVPEDGKLCNIGFISEVEQHKKKYYKNLKVVALIKGDGVSILHAYDFDIKSTEPHKYKGLVIPNGSGLELYSDGYSTVVIDIVNNFRYKVKLNHNGINLEPISKAASEKIAKINKVIESIMGSSVLDLDSVVGV